MTRAKDISKIVTDADLSGTLDVTGAVTAGGLTMDTGGNSTHTLEFGANRTSDSQALGIIRASWNSTVVSQINLSAGDDTTNKDNGQIFFRTAEAGTTANRLRIEENGDISFYEDTGTTPKLFWDASAESLGIGTSSPYTLLELSSTDPILRFNDSNGGTDTKNFEIRYVGTSSPDIDGLYFRTVNDANSVYSDKMVVLGSGNVGIGTSSPETILHVRDTSAIMRLVSDTNSTSGVDFGDTADTNIGRLLYDHTDNSMRFTTNTSEAMRITSDGNVLIGRTSELNDFGDGRTSLVLQGTGSQDYSTIQLGNNGTASNTQILGILAFYDGTENNARVQAIRATSTDSADLLFWTRPASGSLTERIRITSGGNVGIGTSSGTAPLEISNSATNSLRIHRDFATNSASSATIRFAGDDSAGNVTDYAEIRSLTEVVTNGSEAGALLFGTLSSGSVTERVRIDSSGNVLVGCTALPSGGAGGAGFEAGQSNGRTLLQLGTTTTSQITVQRFYNPNGNVGEIKLSGSSTIYSTSSDYRLKENVTADWDATTRLKQLNPVRFNFIADADTTVDGFLAHEVQSVVPEAISGTHNEVDADGNPVYQGIDQSKIVPLLTKTIQELEERITALENGE